MTQAQIRTELYNALYNDTVLPNNIFWIGKPTATSDYPCIVYQFMSAIGGYAFQDGLNSEEIIIQLDIYTDTDDKTNMDTIMNQLDIAMGNIGYRNIAKTIETFLEDIQKIVRPTRWAKWNV